jgi:hypothetical protein
MTFIDLVVMMNPYMSFYQRGGFDPRGPPF